MNSTKEIQERTEPHKEEAPIDDRLVSAGRTIGYYLDAHVATQSALATRTAGPSDDPIHKSRWAGVVQPAPSEGMSGAGLDPAPEGFSPEAEDVPAVIIGSGPTPGPKHTAARIAQTNVGWPPLPVAATRQHWHNLSFLSHPGCCCSILRQIVRSSGVRIPCCTFFEKSSSPGHLLGRPRHPLLLQVRAEGPTGRLLSPVKG